MADRKSTKAAATDGKYKTAAGDFSAFKQEQEQGFRGVVADQTPNEAYTAGEAATSKTPETIPPGEEGTTRADPDALYGGARGPGEPIEGAGLAGSESGPPAQEPPKSDNTNASSDDAK